jgi:hypothetical protein
MEGGGVHTSLNLSGKRDSAGCCVAASIKGDAVRATRDVVGIKR